MPRAATPPTRSPAAAGDAAAAALAALDVNEAAHPCTGCGAPAPPAGEEPFQRCPLCVDAKYAVAPTRFCGRECQKKHWEEHRAWHKEKDEGMADYKVRDEHSTAFLLKQAVNEAAADNEYDRLRHKRRRWSGTRRPASGMPSVRSSSSRIRQTRTLFSPTHTSSRGTRFVRTSAASL